MRRVLREHGLAIVMFGLFFLFLTGQTIAGHREFNADRKDHGGGPVGLVTYLGTGHFLEALTENWESEFLQLGSYVVFTIFLFQKGSAESKSLEGKEKVDADPRHGSKRGAPWPVRRGGFALAVYEHSLSITLFGLFLLSLMLHAWGGAREFTLEELAHGGDPVSMGRYLTTSRFWFESFQNWQSEYLAVGLLAVLTVFLRQRGSPESKPVAAPTWETGSE